MAVIFDLDQTLVDSRCVEPLRRSRRWQQVYNRIPDCTPYAGVVELLQSLASWNIPIGIVTSSPRSYCERLLMHLGWSVAATVCYHDTGRHKPHPDPILKALERLGVAPDGAVSVGDMAHDVIAAQKAGVFAVAALWGSPEPQALLHAGPDLTCHTVAELHRTLARRFQS